MGRKVHPYGFRLGTSRTWNAKWFADKQYTTLLKEDITIRQLVGQAPGQCERVAGRHRARHQPRHRDGSHRQAGHRHRQGRRERRGAAPADRPDHHVQGQARDQGDPPARARRGPGGGQHRPAAEPAHRLPQGAQAVHPAHHEGRRQGRPHRVSGRLGGSEMARREWDKEGRIPLNTLRADISYGQVHAHTTYGRIGVKVWIYRGDIMPTRQTPPEAAAAGAA